MLLVIYFTVLVLIHNAYSFGKFDLNSLPTDLKPVQYLVGRWQFESVVGEGHENFFYGKTLEFGIDPIPAFGARSLNYTAITYDVTQPSEIGNTSRVAHFESGFLPVKNWTKDSLQILCAFLTQASEGYSIIEFGLIDNLVIKLEMNRFLSRSFDMNVPGGSYQIYELQREIRMGTRLEQYIKARTSFGKADFTVYYKLLFNDKL